MGPLTDRTKAEDKMESGIFVGFLIKSSEYILTANGEADNLEETSVRKVDQP